MGKIERRAFLGSISGVLGSVAVTGATASHHEWPKWSGWRYAPNQVIVYGYWFRPIRDRLIRVATTGGLIQDVRDAEMIDLMHEKEWPLLSVLASDAELETRKQRSRVLLDGN